MELQYLVDRDFPCPPDLMGAWLEKLDSTKGVREGITPSEMLGRHPKNIV